eukprot:362220-Chlamydomonas_euryale.AAC.17
MPPHHCVCRVCMVAPHLHTIVCAGPHQKPRPEWPKLSFAGCWFDFLVHDDTPAGAASDRHYTALCQARRP